MKIDGSPITLEDLKKFVDGGVRVSVSPSALARLKKTRKYCELKLKSDEPFYGINTGFGILADKRIPMEGLAKLQENLVVSHAVGVGDPFEPSIVRLIMLLRVNTLAKGYSGVRPETVKLLVGMINKDVLPVIPSQGSVGASGDLAPLAHLALAMIGRGDVFFKGSLMPASVAFKKAELNVLKLEAKEGISLVNGTQAMTAMGVLSLIKLENLMRVADIVGAMSIEGDRASRRPFDPRIHRLRPHPGQLKVAANVRRLIRGSRIIASHAKCRRVQDAYSFRCIPQVHGAVRDAIEYARSVVMREIGSSTDNPLIFSEDDEILSGGNFHGEPLALALDMVAIATAEFGSISERRVALLTAPLAREIPVMFLVPNPGLNSGFMIPHVTMSALVSENKVLAHPASVDSIPTSGGQEDHVSMGAISARKALAVIKNCEIILSIELLAACQAIDLQLDFGLPGIGTKAAFDFVRKSVPVIKNDREFRCDIARCVEIVRSGGLVSVVEKACGRLR